MVKITFLVLTLVFGGLTLWMYKTGEQERDNFGAGIVCLVALILTVIFALSATFLPRS